MSSAVLKIGLIEPSAACAAELGQVLGDALADVSFELLCGDADADFLLMDNTAPPLPTPLRNPTVLFARSTEGIYTAQALRGPVPVFSQQNIVFPLPLAKALQHLAAAALEHRAEQPPAAVSPSRRLHSGSIHLLLTQRRSCTSAYCKRKKWRPWESSQAALLTTSTTS